MHVIAATTRCGLSDLTPRQNARRLLDLGFQKLVLHAGLENHEWLALQEYLRRGTVAAAHLFAPLRCFRQREIVPPRLGSLDADERREVVKRGRETVEFLDHNDIPLLIVPPPALEDLTIEDVEKVFARPPAAPAVARLLRKRSGEATREQLDSYLGALDRILHHADHYGKRVALIPGGLPHELPDDDELRRCLEEFAGAPLGVMADMVRFERSRAIRGTATTGLPEHILDRLLGVVVHDGDLVRSRLPLGEAGVDLERWKKAVAASSGEPIPAESWDQVWTIDLAQDAGETAIAATRERIEALLVGDRPPAETGDPFLDRSLTDFV